MNFFGVLLCLAMNRPYQLYYFVPLISFWFLVQFVAFWLPPQVRLLGPGVQLVVSAINTHKIIVTNF